MRGHLQERNARAWWRVPPEFGRRAVCEGQVGLIEGLHGSNVLPVAIIQVCLDVHAHVLRARDHLTAEVIGLLSTATQLGP